MIYLEELRNLLLKNDIPVSKIEYTSENFDHNGTIIKEELPTITTNICEIGLYDEEIYFVFIIESETFNKKLFELIESKRNSSIYGFKYFKQNFYPKEDFNYDAFLKEIKKDKYLQIQFDFKMIKPAELYQEYCNLAELFKINKAKVINQLKVNLKNKIVYMR